MVLLASSTLLPSVLLGRKRRKLMRRSARSGRTRKRVESLLLDGRGQVENRDSTELLWAALEGVVETESGRR
jgi:hypothetical protein